MIRIPLERVLERIAEEIDRATPAGDDPYARAQLEAAAELLRNLAPRVQWRDDAELEAEIEATAAQPDSPARRKALAALASRQLDLELGRLRR